MNPASPLTVVRNENGIPFNATQLSLKTHREGEHTILGITGQAGAGKSTFAKRIHGAYADAGLNSLSLGIDWWFILSSRERKQWLVDGDAIGGEEAARRRNQQSWWDFDRLERDLLALRRGETVHLRGVYNRDDGGELTLNVDLTPDPAGTTFILEGVAIAHLEAIDHLVYLHVSPEVRRRRLEQRDRQRSGAEHDERFKLTQSFEQRYFPLHWRRISLFIYNEGLNPVLLSHLHPHEALQDLNAETNEYRTFSTAVANA